MRIGIISNSDCCIPLAYTLAAQQLQVCIYYAAGNEPFVNQKVQAFTKQNQIPLFQEKQDNDFYQWINAGKYDACFIIGYRKLIQIKKVNGSADRIFNIHFSSLPAYKGPVPVFWQLRAGEQTLGISIHRLNEKFDEGNVLWRKEIKNQDFLNYQMTLQLLSQLCVEGALFILQMLLNGISIVPLFPSDSTVSSYQTRPKAGDVIVQWETMTAQEICHLIRACNPWNKGAITFYKNQEVKLMDAVLAESEETSEKNVAGMEPGTIQEINKSFQIYCSDRNIISVNMLFFQECYIPTYQCNMVGFVKGERFRTPTINNAK